MARVTGTLPAPSILTATRVDFGTALPDSPLEDDVSALSTTDAVVLRLIRLNSPAANPRRIFLQVSLPGEGSGFQEELTDAWEASAIALTLSAPTLPDIVIIGPASPGLDLNDPTEPYRWKLSVTQDAAAYSNGSSSGIGGWITDFNGLSAAQRASVDYILDDGEQRFAGTEGLSVQFGGAAASGVETRARIRRRLNEIGDARLTMIGAPADLTIPEDGDTVTITDVGESRVLFGGNVRTPSVEIIDGGDLLEITVPCVGHEQRLQDTIISPADGIRIVQLATAAEQVQEIVKLLEGEGFTTGALPDLGAYAEDMRFKPAYGVLRAIVEAASAVLIVSPEKEVTAPLLTALPSSGVTLDSTNTTDPRRSVDPKDRRTTQYLIGGVLDRTLAFVGDGSAKAFDLTGTEDPTDIEITLGAPTDVGTTGIPAIQFVQWGFRTGVSYGDLSALSDPPGDSVLLRRLRIGTAISGLTTSQKLRRIELNTSTTTSETSNNREDLSVGWEDSLRAITIKAPGLEDLVIPGPRASGVEDSDASEPYKWIVSQAQADAMYGGAGLEAWKLAIEALSSSERDQMQGIFSDGTTAAEGISLSVRSVSRVTVNNVEVDPAPDDEGSEWRFDLPSQQVIQDAAATALTSSQTLRVGISANRVAEDVVDEDPPVGRVLRATDVLDSDAILARVVAEREAHTDPAERIRGGIAIGAKLHVDIGQTVAMDTTFAGLLQVDTPAASDTWVLSVVTIQTAGDLLRYSFATQRDRYETESLDYWRELRAAPAD